MSDNFNKFCNVCLKHFRNADDYYAHIAVCRKQVDVHETAVTPLAHTPTVLVAQKKPRAKRTRRNRYEIRSRVQEAVKAYFDSQSPYKTLTQFEITFGLSTGTLSKPYAKGLIKQWCNMSDRQATQKKVTDDYRYNKNR